MRGAVAAERTQPQSIAHSTLRKICAKNCKQNGTPAWEYTRGADMAEGTWLHWIACSSLTSEPRLAQVTSGLTQNARDFELCTIALLTGDTCAAQL